MKLLLLEDYYSSRGGYKAGQVIDVPDRDALWLLADAPGCFEVVEEKAMDAPPVDKQIKRPARKK